MRIVIVLSLLILNSCASPNGREEKKVFYENKLLALKDSLLSLKIEYEISENYIKTAEMHQVTRSLSEKKKQLKNLNSYRAELNLKIQKLEMFSKMYKDSLAHVNR